MRDVVEHNQGEYSVLIADIIANYKTAKLVPGKDVTFLQVTHSANPNTASTKLPNGVDYGFNWIMIKIYFH